MHQVYTLYTNKNEVTVEFSRSWEQERSTLRTFVILIVLNYKRAKQSKRRVVRIQSALCEVACEQNSYGLKIFIVKF